MLSPKIGDIFDDKYEIEAILGSGGNGTVYKAQQLDCKRTIALKILFHDIGQDEEYRSRFLREAQTLSKLSHENIVTVYHLGVSSSDVAYLVMEYVEGQSLRAIINSVDRLPVLRALRIIRAAAMALSYMHGQGIVHRDIKPENILISQVPDADTVKLVDFGLVRFTNNEDQKLTSTGEVLGTVKYMSPEQCMGEAVDSRTDIYSLSVCLYELVTGIAPFDADTAVGIMYKHINEPVPKIESTKLDRFHPSLNDLVLKGMSKDRLQRFDCMESLANSIDSVIDLLPTKAPFILPSKLKMIGISLVLLCGAVVLWTSSTRKTSQTHSSQGKTISVASNQSTEAKYEREYERLITRGDTYNTELVSSLENLISHYAEKHESAKTVALLELLLRIKTKKYGPDLVDQNLGFVARLADQYHLVGKEKEAEKLYKRVLAITEKRHGPFDIRVADILFRLASFYSHDNYLQAVQLYRRSLAIYYKAREGSGYLANQENLDQNIAWCSDGMANCYLKLGKYAEAESTCKGEIDFWNRILAKSERELGPNDLITANLLVSVASSMRRAKYLLNQQKDITTEVAPLLKRALTIFESVPGNEANIANVLRKLGDCCISQAKNLEAETFFKRALSIEEGISAGDDSLIIPYLDCLAGCYREQGKYAEAEQLFKRALMLTEKTSGANDPKIANRLFDLATFYLLHEQNSDADLVLTRAWAVTEKGRNSSESFGAILELAETYINRANFAEAESVLRRLLAMQKKMDPVKVSQFSTMETQRSMARCYLQQGNYEKAENLLRRVMAIFEKRPNIAYLENYNNLSSLLADCCLQQGRGSAAQLLCERCLQAREKFWTKFDDPAICQSVNSLANCYVSQGKYAGAESLYKRSLSIRKSALPPAHPLVAYSLFDLAALYIIMDRNPDAEPLIRRGWAIWENAASPHNVSSLSRVAHAYAIQGHYTEAEKLYKVILSTQEKTHASHLDIIETKRSLADCYLQQGKYKESNALLQTILLISEKELGANSPELAAILDNLACYYLKIGLYVKAEPLLQRSLDIRTRLEQGNTRHVAETLFHLSECFLQQAKCAEAEPLLKRSLAIWDRESDGPERHAASVASTLCNIANCYQKQGRFAEAKDFSKRSLECRKNCHFQ